MKILVDDNKLELKGMDRKSCLATIASCVLFFIPVGSLLANGYLSQYNQRTVDITKPGGVLFILIGVSTLLYAFLEKRFRTIEVRKGYFSSKGKFKNWEAFDNLEIKIMRGVKGIGWMLVILNPSGNTTISFMYKKDAAKIAELIRKYFGDSAKVLHEYF